MYNPLIRQKRMLCYVNSVLSYQCCRTRDSDSDSSPTRVLFFKDSDSVPVLKDSDSDSDSDPKDSRTRLRVLNESGKIGVFQCFIFINLPEFCFVVGQKSAVRRMPIY